MSDPATPAARPATLVLLVRHGRTPTTGRDLPGRAPGLSLDGSGRDQAQRLAARLAGLRIDALYSSPLERAQETAAPTARRTGLAVREEPGLLEGEFGDWTGRPLAELTALPAWQDVQRHPAGFRFPGGESFAEMQARMVGTIERLRREHEGGTVVCFSHADPIRLLLAHALGTPLDAFQRISVGTASVSAISYATDRDPVVLTVSSTTDSLAQLTAS
ncbi:histidine phosphatase family protein [Brachybacterium sp. YJGR34]|uniref:histidine phosphatase family protein n=1 Tax=Brachybacterium sp. YJGR34 TaxID=2059911 RepID=UPI000E0A323E|nr:histidine phosphatase family protein [Brachybacterium sp. YJGR34]